jgi:hypothetical protein
VASQARPCAAVCSFQHRARDAAIDAQLGAQTLRRGGQKGLGRGHGGAGQGQQIGQDHAVVGDRLSVTGHGRSPWRFLKCRCPRRDLGRLQVQRNKNAAESRITNENVPPIFALQHPSDHDITSAKGTRMLTDTLSLMPLWAFAVAIGVTLFAGFVKGAIGFAMPLIMISGLSLFIDPLIAIAGIILPIVMSNFLQAIRFGLPEMKATVVEYWRYILIVCVAIVDRRAIRDQRADADLLP